MYGLAIPRDALFFHTSCLPRNTFKPIIVHPPSSIHRTVMKLDSIKLCRCTTSKQQTPHNHSYAFTRTREARLLRLLGNTAKPHPIYATINLTVIRTNSLRKKLLCAICLVMRLSRNKSYYIIILLITSKDQ